MKTLALIVIALAGVVCAQAEICGYHFDSVGTGGSRSWSRAQETPCFMPGGTCKITAIECPPSGVVVTSGSGFMFTGNIQSIEFGSINISPTETQTTSGTGFTFKNGDAWLTISNCSAYPQLQGVSVNLANVSVSSQGVFQVYIPVNN